MTPSEFAALHRLTPSEAVSYLQGRGQLAISYAWQDVWQAEHATQFTISRLARLDLIKAFQDAILASVQGDLSRRDYTRDLTALLKLEGWWGTKDVVDPQTGDTVQTTFDPARLKLIYDVNTSQAYAAGAWERFDRNRATHPYLRYITKRDERVRASHRAWDNVTLPIDHPWWNTHYPPNGWRCRCRVMNMTQAEYDAGHTPTGDALKKTAPAEDLRKWENKRTGEVLEVPRGVDPGFGYNVGKAALDAKAGVLNSKLVGNMATGQSPVLAAATLDDVFQAGVFDRWHLEMEQRVAAELARADYVGLDMNSRLKLLRSRLDDGQAWPVAVLDADLRGLLNVDASIVQFSSYDAIKQIVSRTGQDFGPEDYRSVQSVLDSAKLVVELGDTRYAFLPQGRKVYMAVLHVTQDRGEVFLKSYRSAFAPEEVRALRRRGKVLKDEWDG